MGGDCCTLKNYCVYVLIHNTYIRVYLNAVCHTVGVPHHAGGGRGAGGGPGPGRAVLDPGGGAGHTAGLHDICSLAGHGALLHLAGLWNASRGATGAVLVAPGQDPGAEPLAVASAHTSQEGGRHAQGAVALPYHKPIGK